MFLLEGCPILKEKECNKKQRSWKSINIHLPVIVPFFLFPTYRVRKNPLSKNNNNTDLYNTAGKYRSCHWCPGKKNIQSKNLMSSCQALRMYQKAEEIATLKNKTDEGNHAVNVNLTTIKQCNKGACFFQITFVWKEGGDNWLDSESFVSSGSECDSMDKFIKDETQDTDVRLFIASLQWNKYSKRIDSLHKSWQSKLYLFQAFVHPFISIVQAARFGTTIKNSQK